jgi:glycosyltransferase involved in cell wall biosynthesis
MGHEVHFLYVNTEDADEWGMQRCWGDNFYLAPYKFPPRSLPTYMKRLKFIFQRGFRHLKPLDFRYDKSLDDFLASLSRRIHFDIVIVEYVYWSRALNCFDRSVLKIIDTHDVYAWRHLIYLKKNEKYFGYSTSENEEAKGLRRADVIIAIQEHEKVYLSKISQKKTVTVGHIGPLERLAHKTSLKKNILFVGSRAGHNIHGIKYFINEVFPRIRNTVPDVELIVVGDVCNSIDNYEGCLKLGEVEDLKPIYEKADVVINPRHFGTGLSIKTIEPLGYSKPVVATSMGSKGLEAGANKAFLLADDPATFAESVINVLMDPKLSKKLSQAAYEFVERWNRDSLRELADILN